MSSTPFTLRFGIEMEIYLRPRPATYELLDQHGFNDLTRSDKNYFPLRKALAEWLSIKAVPTVAFLGDYIHHWSIIDEKALDDIPGFCKSILRPSAI